MIFTAQDQKPHSICKALLLTLICFITMLPFGSMVLANGDDNLQLSGFASFGAGRINRSDLPFLNYSEKLSFRSDTVIGGQAQYKISNRWSVTGQVVSRGFTFDDNDKFDPVLEWLFIRYQWSSTTRFRIGRMRTPFYLLSDSLEIGYSYPWVRPPVDVYSFLLSPISNFNGVDFSTNFDIGDADLELQLFAGNAEGEYLDFDIDISPITGANFISIWDDITLRYGITLAYTDAASKALTKFSRNYDFFLAVHPTFREIRDSHQTEGEWFQYHSLGLQWDIDSWSISSETYAIVGPDKDFANDAKGWYISISKQIYDFSPYIVLGYYKNVFSDDIAEQIEHSKLLVPEGVPGLASLDALRNRNLQIIDTFDEKGKTYTAGIRYDFHSNAAVKIEVQYFNSTALLTRDNETHSKEGSLLTSMVIDVVF